MIFLRLARHVASIVTLLLVFAGCALAQSQPPTPGEPETSQEQQPAGESEPQNRDQIDNTPAATSEEVRTEAAEQRDDEPSEDWRIVLFTGILTLVAVLQLVAMIVQSKFMRDGLTETKHSIAEATRSAQAMETMAIAMTASAANTEKALAISRETADRQKFVSELSSRAYLAVQFYGGTYQDATHDFSGEVEVVNRGLTPTYKVMARARARIVPFPVPNDFDFALTLEDDSESISFITHSQSKTFRRQVSTSERVPDDEVRAVTLGDGKCLLMYGIVQYADVFGRNQYTWFSHVIRWQYPVAGTTLKDRDGNPVGPRTLSSDTRGHNHAT